MAPTYIFSCDWGTSCLRVKLIERQTKCVVGEWASDDGVASFADHTDNMRKNAMSNILEKAAATIADKQRIDIDKSTAFIVSGMASSSIGMEFLPYARLPFDLAGKDIIRRQIHVSGLSQCWLISGIASEHDVMRGEETQLIGLHQRKSLPPTYYCILPGTHSKHAQIENGVVTAFETFVTGELFELLSEHSVLRASVNHPLHARKEMDMVIASADYLAGVEDGYSLPLLQGIFRVRTGEILLRRSPDRSTEYLSGLLIGNELASALGNMNAWPREVVLCGKPTLVIRYRWAFDWISKKKRKNSQIHLKGNSTVDGHLALLNQLLETSL